MSYFLNVNFPQITGIKTVKRKFKIDEICELLFNHSKEVEIQDQFTD
jgi:hypothetical protein